MKYILILAIALTIADWTNANPQFDVSQPIAGRTTTSWSFMTAWNLSTGALEVSPRWYTGRSIWLHAAAEQRQWTARFIYDEIKGLTRELAWFYTDAHVQ